MSYEVVHQQALTIMGISARASNAEPQKIGDLWRAYHAAGGHHSIAARLSDASYCVYCEYEGDYRQPFTVVIGCEVPAGTIAQNGYRLITISPGSYAVYKPAGELPQAVFDTWSEVWRTPLDRMYHADFDRYGATGASVHVGVR